MQRYDYQMITVSVNIVLVHQSCHQAHASGLNIVLGTLRCFFLDFREIFMMILNHDRSSNRKSVWVENRAMSRGRVPSDQLAKVNTLRVGQVDAKPWKTTVFGPSIWTKSENLKRPKPKQIKT